MHKKVCGSSEMLTEQTQIFSTMFKSVNSTENARSLKQSSNVFRTLGLDSEKQQAT